MAVSGGGLGEICQADECLSILQGVAIPTAEELCDTRECYRLHRLAFIHAIRHVSGYADRPSVSAICTSTTDGRSAAFARTYYARQIMSNTVPDLDSTKTEFLPYCIWYPDLATEETYREVARRYPALSYQVGRACAVAGYERLYQELDILPDVSIAEEARSSDHGKAIYDMIMQRHLRYRAMDDYTRTILQPPEVNAFLNCDTALASSLAARVHYRSLEKAKYPPFPDLKEDQNIGIADHPIPEQVFMPDDAFMLYQPLPRDLPAVPNKDTLILLAAYYGNVDRYVRLRRPRMIEHERAHCIRGVYHSTTFAKWWSVQPDVRDYPGLLAACHARFIMVSDLTWLDQTDPPLPYLIWWPIRPTNYTVFALWLRKPEMAQAVAHACIYSNYEELFRRIKPRYSRALVKQAELEYDTNPFYCNYFRQDSEQPASPRPDPDMVHDPETAIYTATGFRDVPKHIIPDCIDGIRMQPFYEDGIYEGIRVDHSDVDLFMCTSPERLNKMSAMSETAVSRVLYFDEVDAWEEANKPSSDDDDDSIYSDVIRENFSRPYRRHFSHWFVEPSHADGGTHQSTGSEEEGESDAEGGGGERNATSNKGDDIEENQGSSVNAQGSSLNGLPSSSETDMSAKSCD